MAAKKFVALDTNFVLDLAGRDPAAKKLAEVLQARRFSLLITDTVIQELADKAEDEKDEAHEEAVFALAHIREWKITPVLLKPLQRGYAEQFSEYVRRQGLLNTSEKNDGEILAEASIAEATFVISSDAHLCRIDEHLLRVAYSDKGLDPVTVVNKKKMLKTLGM
jgi:rRNA-processing protein FCF1